MKLKRRPLKSLQRVDKDDNNAFPWGPGKANPVDHAGGTQRPIPQLPLGVLGTRQPS